MGRQKMAPKDFILQGFTHRTHIEAINALFDVPDVKRVLLSVAFVTQGGVDLLAASLAKHAAETTVFAGIRNDLTSHQALGRLHTIGVKLYAVDTGSRNIVFHPKIYLVRGHARARAVLGSANLTIGGLHNNIEASVILDFNLSVASDKAVVDSIEDQLGGLPKEYPLHVLKISSLAQLNDMKASGRLVDEMATTPPRPSTTAVGGSADPVPRIVLKVLPIRMALKAAPKVTPQSAKPPPKPKLTVTAKGSALSTPATIGIEYELVWESKPLTRRDLTIPTGANSHATGSINLDKGLLEETVDHRNYFRDNVFSGLVWTTTNTTGKVEEAFAKFQLVLKAVSYGEFDLRIGHSTDKKSKMYKQRNAMTRLSWGPMRAYIAHSDLIGRNLTIFRDKVDPKRFLLEID